MNEKYTDYLFFSVSSSSSGGSGASMPAYLLPLSYYSGGADSRSL